MLNLSPPSVDHGNTTVDDVDRAVLDFLRLLDSEMVNRSGLVEAVDRAQLKRIGRLVSGVTVS